MHKAIPAHAFVVWALTSVAQGFLGFIARRTQPALSAYALLELMMSVVGLSCLLFGPPGLYLKAYITAGYVDELITIALLIVWLNQLRMAATPIRAKRIYLALWVVICFTVSIHLMHLPIPELAGSPLSTYRTLGHLTWCGLCFVIATVPLYAVIVVAVPSRSLLLRILGLGIYIAAHASSITLLITKVFRNAPAVKTASDSFYFITLSIWYLSMLSQKSTVPAPELPEPHYDVADTILVADNSDDALQPAVSPSLLPLRPYQLAAESEPGDRVLS